VRRADDCARQSVIVSPVLVRFWQLARRLSLLTQKVIKKRTLPYPDADMGTVRLRLQETARKFSQARSPNRLDNYGIFALDHNTSMRAYTFLGKFLMLGDTIEIILRSYGTSTAYWHEYLSLFYDTLQRAFLLSVLRYQQECLDMW
jgi:hypothetical protein